MSLPIDVTIAGIPDPTGITDGYVMTVNSNVYTLAAPTGGTTLPDPTGHNGKVVGVVSDAYALVTDQTGGSSGSPYAQGGRLTLTSGLSITTTDITAAGTIYFTPHSGDQIGLYDGTSAWTILSFTELSISLAAGFTSGKPYDVFAYNNSGVVALETVVWTNDTTRATALTKQNGIYVKNGATTRRYIGTFYTSSATTTEDSVTKRYVWNYYNRSLRSIRIYDSTGSWNYSTQTWRYANANSANRFDCVIGVAEDAASCNLVCSCKNSTATARVVYSIIGLDVTDASNIFSIGTEIYVNNVQNRVISFGDAIIPAGKHFLSWLEYGAGTDTQTWIGGNAGGLIGSIRA